MTEVRSSASGWRTTAVVAPAAAAAFAVATGWAVAHPPATASSAPAAATVAPAQPAAEPPVDHAQISLQSRAQQLHGRVVHLERVLARLRARTHAVRQAPLPAFGGGGAQPVSGASGGGSYGGSGGGSVVAPPPAAAAPAPATHTSTGASGAR